MTFRAFRLIGPLGLGVCLVAFAIALVATNLVAVDRFRHAAASSQELSDIQAVASAAAEMPASDAAVERAVRRYREAVLTETRIVAPGGDAGQITELHDADELLAAAGDGDRARLARRIGIVAERERREASSLASDMDALRRQAAWLAALLGLAAIASSALAARSVLGDRRRLEREVGARTAELVATDRTRRLFFAKVSHELRTPVTVMRGEAEVALAGDAAPEPLREALEQVVASAEELERRIADLLGLARADNGQLELERAPFDLAAMACDAAERVARQARAAAVSVRVLPAAPAAVVGDRRWLLQAMAAVLDNAIRFSPIDGRIDVTVRQEAGHAKLAIADQGNGMSPSVLEHAFDAYFRAEPTGTGSGLGLALARWVVEQHGGTIAAANGVDGGCIVTLRLPVAA